MRKLDRGQSLFVIVIAALAAVIVITQVTNPTANHKSLDSTGNQTVSTLHSKENASTTTVRTTTTTGLAYIPAPQAVNHLNQFETVRVNIAYTFTDSAGTEFLDQYANYTSGFVVCIFSSDLANFPVNPATAYWGSTIDVTGLVTTYNGYVEILNPSRIQVVA